jgi:hypothetical protein
MSVKPVGQVALPDNEKSDDLDQVTTLRQSFENGEYP